jgi:hypothetical protein
MNFYTSVIVKTCFSSFWNLTVAQCGFEKQAAYKLHIVNGCIMSCTEHHCDNLYMLCILKYDLKVHL